MDTQEHAIGYPNKKKKLKVSGLKITSEENQEQSSISTEDVVILDSPPMPVEERVDHGMQVKVLNVFSSQFQHFYLHQLIGKINNTVINCEIREMTSDCLLLWVLLQLASKLLLVVLFCLQYTACKYYFQKSSLKCL